MISMLFLTASGGYGRDELRYDEEGNLITDDPGAKIAANFPQITGGVLMLFDEDVTITPTMGLRYRLFPQLKGEKEWIKWAQVIAPDFVTLQVGAPVLAAGVGLELIPEILTLNTVVGWKVPEEKGLHFYVGLDILKF